MYTSKSLIALTYIGQAFSSGLTTLGGLVSRGSARELTIITDDDALCPLVHGQPDFDLLMSQHNTSFDRQSTCIWSDNHEQQYCLFADPYFNHGKGIAIITTPERAQHILRSITSISDYYCSPKPSFTTRRSGSKGRGIFASRYIPAGSLITQEPPIIFIDRNWMVDVSSEEARVLLQVAAVENLPRKTRQIFQELYPGQQEESLKQRIWTNGYGVAGGPRPEWPGLDSESDLGMIAVHANISKINHSCRANAAAQWDWDLLAYKLWAVRDIPKDEEVTISYLHPIQILQQRQEFAKNTLGFECSCNQCKAPSRFNELSDDRINEILLLEQALENRQIAPAEPIAIAGLLVSLYKEEGLYTHICKAYAFAALEWNGVGHEYQARSWAYQSIRAGLVAGSGAGMEEYVEDMEDLLNGARKHWSWKYRVRS